MPRPPRTDRPVEKSVSFPQSVAVRVDLLLLSPLEQKVPHGAWSKYLLALVEADLAKRASLPQQLAEGKF